ncbi:uncharacterized protein SAPINGB_P004878 [Magnusiomyces paraingens]|uniref:Uncharacterized protein n=1 Tax=Magnusiomyces paraingens TaxID=2606893 RepID=A0A5E8C4V0_9ASCO|nr:uncharacterized protein SAPINGB_P004878 [Saprochaete ingens]VVT56176.1 unnamed protein product [Saprochaete ingens]
MSNQQTAAQALAGTSDTLQQTLNDPPRTAPTPTAPNYAPPPTRWQRAMQKLAWSMRKFPTSQSMAMFKKYLTFAGGSAFICTSYIDPGNYSTDVQAGAQFRFHLLFVIFFSNCLAIFLQSLAIRLGTVSGRDLAQISKEQFPRWLNLILYVLAEAAIIATDIAEVVGTAVALNILMHIPLIVGVIITILDVLIVLMAYRSEQSIRIIRYFEYGVAALVVGVAICFAIQLKQMPPTPAADVFRGYLPSHHLLESGAMYASCGILGATVMPHSLYLGSSIVKPRVIDKDVRLGNVPENYTSEDFDNYKPSVEAINYSLKYSTVELAVSLCTFAFFVNSAILIVSGATLYNNDSTNTADLFSIYDSLKELISKGAATLFMVALLLSGQSAGIVCTVAGQIVSEGYLNWNIKKTWIRRLITRTIAVVPCLIVTAAVGRKGLSQVLNASQTALSILLPFLVFPLVYFTCKPSVMCVEVNPKKPAQVPQNCIPLQDLGITKSDAGPSSLPNSSTLEPTFSKESKKSKESKRFTVTETEEPEPLRVNYTNGWFVMIFGYMVWLFIAVLNVYLIVQLAMGNT